MEERKSFDGGAKVKTNQGYFDTFNRTVYGIVYNPPFPELAGSATVVFVTKQEGERIIPEHTGNYLLMRTEDLEEDEDEETKVVH